MTDKEYIQWFRTATPREVKFINTYLKTLNANAAYQAAGYSMKTKKQGLFKVYRRLMPYIQYKLQKDGCSVSKDFIIAKWIQILQDGDFVSRQAALRELAKLFGYNDQSTKINIENNVPQTPVKIVFGDQNEENNN